MFFFFSGFVGFDRDSFLPLNDRIKQETLVWNKPQLSRGLVLCSSSSGSESRPIRTGNNYARAELFRGKSGLVYLHEFSPKKYVHGDLKPSNVLIGQDMDPKISDFGLARLANIAGGSSPTIQSNRIIQLDQKLQERQQHHHKSVSSEFTAHSFYGSYYQAPETLKMVKPSQKWDVYSYGVILLEMIAGKCPVVEVGTSEIDQVRWIQVCIEEKKPLCDVLDPCLVPEADKEDEIIAVLKIAISCVNSSPEKRPSMRHISDTLDRLPVARD